MFTRAMLNREAVTLCCQLILLAYQMLRSLCSPEKLVKPLKHKKSHDPCAVSVTLGALGTRSLGKAPLQSPVRCPRKHAPLQIVNARLCEFFVKQARRAACCTIGSVGTCAQVHGSVPRKSAGNRCILCLSAHSDILAALASRQSACPSPSTVPRTHTKMRCRLDSARTADQRKTSGVLAGIPGGLCGRTEV